MYSGVAFDIDFDEQPDFRAQESRGVLGGDGEDYWSPAAKAARAAEALLGSPDRGALVAAAAAIGHSEWVTAVQFVSMDRVTTTAEVVALSPLPLHWRWRSLLRRGCVYVAPFHA